MVTVDEKGDVAAFADYKAPDIPSEAALELKHEEHNILNREGDDSSVNVTSPNLQQQKQVLPIPPPPTTTLPKPATPTVNASLVIEKDVTTGTAEAKPTITSRSQLRGNLDSIPWGENIKNGPLYHR